uniref:CSON002599 protein n=1 Tax=Culicoides sonorensis TaxID=179676 RepID=A0A336L2Z3_CULSO
MGNNKKDPGGQVKIDCNSPVPDLNNQMANPNLPTPLTLEEKKYLLAVERGDLANVRRILQRGFRKRTIDVNCVDSFGRGAITLAIDSENLEMVELLVVMGVQTKDALLQAINAEFVEAAELLLEHEELIHKEGEPYSWQKVDICTSMFTPEITPLMLAAHKNNYEILKILLDRGATLPMPHDTKCGCDTCIQQSSEDSLRHSLSRVNEYRALASPSLIALSSTDPLLTAFQLSWQLRELAFTEQECKTQYLELRKQCQQFAVDLLDQTRTSQELAIILNHDPEAPPYMDGDHMPLSRLEQAIHFKQKKFVAHPNIQQLLSSLWYEGVPGFRRKTGIQKLGICIKVAALFPFYCLMYMFFPNSESSKLMRKPFMKFLIHASSYLFFLFVVILVSQRAEIQVVLLLGTESMRRAVEEQLARQRGNGPTPLELLLVIYVIGFIWEETQEIFLDGLRKYLANMWNFIDFARNSLYVMVIFLRTLAYIQQSNEINSDPSKAYVPREQWDDFDPQLIAEGLFAAGNVFSALKLVHLFSINPHLGPLQISLGRMVIDIVKFFFIYSLVLFAFACGLNQLLWYFADLEKDKCYSLPGGLPDWENREEACMKWRRFGNLFESSQSLFWASFGMVGLEAFELTGIKSYTRFWGLLMFGSYSVINVIVLLNLLIAMMSNSYAMIDEHSDTEWKFARTKLWLSYFEESGTLPPPFNIFPTTKNFQNLCGRKKRKAIRRQTTIRRKVEEERVNRYTAVMRALVWRYVAAMHRRLDDSPVTDDDINEVKNDISTMRFEMLEIFQKSGMDCSGVDRKERTVLGKKMKVWERRLMKDFHVAPIDVENPDEEPAPEGETSLARFKRIAKRVASETTSGRWNEVMRGVGIEAGTQIGRCRHRQSFKNQQNLQKAMEEARRLVMRSPLPGSPTMSPTMDMMDPTTNTLVKLLQNITEEFGDDERLSVSVNNTRGPSPMHQLGAQLQALLSKNPSPYQTTNLGKAGTSNSKKTPLLGNSPSATLSPPKQKQPSLSPNMSISRINSPPPKTDDPAPEPIQNISVKSPSIDNLSEKSLKLSDSKVSKTTSPEPIKSPPSAKSPPPTIKSPPPPIRVTEHSSVKRQESRDHLVDIDMDIEPSDENAEALSSNSKSPPKVVKRKAPVPTDAIQRPVAPKPSSNQGMIPPPPSKNDEPTVPCLNIPILSTTPATPIPQKKEEIKSDAPPPIPNTPPPQIIEEQPITTQPKPQPKPSPEPIEPTICVGIDAVASDSTEKLISSPNHDIDKNKAASSPFCLRPYNKIEDVKTVKRQPKTGWL